MARPRRAVASTWTAVPQRDIAACPRPSRGPGWGRAPAPSCALAPAGTAAGSGQGGRDGTPLAGAAQLALAATATVTRARAWSRRERRRPLPPANGPCATVGPFQERVRASESTTEWRSFLNEKERPRPTQPNPDSTLRWHREALAYSFVQKKKRRDNSLSTIIYVSDSAFPCVRQSCPDEACAREMRNVVHRTQAWWRIHRLRPAALEMDPTSALISRVVSTVCCPRARRNSQQRCTC
jgi:hypothetical protein